MQLNKMNMARYIQIAMKSIILVDGTIESFVPSSPTHILFCLFSSPDVLRIDASELHSLASWLSFVIWDSNFDLFFFSLLDDFVAISDTAFDSFLRWSMIAIANSTNAKMTNARHTSKYSPNAFNSDSDGLSDCKMYE